MAAEAHQDHGLHHAAKLLGMTVSVSDADEWRIERERILVGTGFYAKWGITDDDGLLVAAALLDLWSSVRFTTAYPARARRRLTMARERPELDTLLTAVDQLQAAGELLDAFPGMLGALASVTRRRIPRDLRRLPWPEQFAAAVVRSALDGTPVRVDEPVRRELRAIDSGILRVAMASDTPSHGMRVQERLLGLLLPPYERLRSEASLEQGLTDAALTGESGEDDHAEADVDFGSDTDGSDERDDATAAEQERARDADARDASEGADLFEAQQAAQVTAVLESPLPITSAAMLDLLDSIETDSHEHSVHDPVGGGPSTPEVRVSILRYRDRLEQFWPHIERMRDVWSDVVNERTSTRRILSRLPQQDGEELHRASLPRALAEAYAGAQRPRAYARFEPHHRERDEPGNTDYILIIDRSGSMRVAAQAAADAALIMVEALAGVARDVADAERHTGVDAHLDIRTALIVFDAEATVVKPLAASMDDASRARLYEEVLATRGGTNDAAALRAAGNEFGFRRSDGTERRRIAIVVSDGESSDPVAAARELRALRSKGVRVFGIGISSDDVARRFAPDGTRIDDPREIVSVIQRLVERTVAEGTA